MRVKQALYGCTLCNIIVLRTRSVQVDIVDISRLQTAFFKAPLMARKEPVPSGEEAV